MIDRNLVTSGFDTETLVSEEYLSYILLAQIEAGLLPLELSIVDQTEGIDVDLILHPPAYDANRLYTAEPTAPLPSSALNSFSFNLQPDESSPVAALAFSPDGLILAGGTWEGSLRFWNVETGLYPNTISNQTNSITAIAYSPDGSSVASSSVGNTIKLMDSATGAVILSFQGHSGPIFDLTFSSNGNRIASVGADRTIRIWDVQTGEELFQLTGHSLPVLCVAFSPDGSKIVSGSMDKTVRTWSTVDGTELSVFDGHVNFVTDVAFSPDGFTIASSSEDKTISIWNESTVELQISITGHEGGVNCIAFSPDGSSIVSGSSDKTLRLWNIADGVELVSYIGHTKSVLCVAFHPNGQSFASGSSDKKIRIWNTDDGGELQILRVVFTHLTVVITATNNNTNTTFNEIPILVHLDMEVESDLTASGLESNHQLVLTLIRLEPAFKRLLEINSIDANAVEDGIRENLDRSVPLGVAQGQQVQKIRMKKFVGEQNSLGLYIDLALKSGPEPGANLDPRGQEQFAQDFRPSGSALAFSTSSNLLSLLGPDLKYRLAEETEEGSGVFKYPLYKDFFDKNSDKIGKLKSIKIRPEKFQSSNTPPINTGRLEVNSKIEYTELPFDPDLNIQVFFRPDIKEGIMDWDIDIDVDFGLLLTVFLAVTGIALTFLFAPGLLWGSSLIAGIIIGVAVLKGIIGEPLAGKILADRFDAESQASFLDAIPFELPVASQRWDPFYITQHTIVSLTEKVVIDDMGIAFESNGIRLSKRPVPINNVVIRDESRSAAGIVNGFRYRVLDLPRITDDLAANAPGVDRMPYSVEDEINDPLLVTLTLEQIAERIEAHRLLAPITLIPKKIQLVNNQIDHLLCISFREKEELIRELTSQWKTNTRSGIIEAVGDDMLESLTEELELSLDRSPTQEELDKAFENKLNGIVNGFLADFNKDLLPNLLESAIDQALKFDLSPEEFVEHQLAKILAIDGKEIIVRHNADGSETPYFRDHPDGDPSDNLLSLPRYSPPYEAPPP